MLDLLWIRDGVLYFRYPKLSEQGRLIHAVFTRQGGVSKAPYDSLNASYAVGDRKHRVEKNLRKIRLALDAKRLIFMNQAHGEHVQILRRDRTREDVPTADAVITDVPHLGIMVKQADCQSVIIWDPKRKVAANVHCGWRGNVQNILGKVVSKMTETFGCRKADLSAAIGPSLGPCCAEFVSHEEIFPAMFKRFMVRDGYFDLWAVSCWQLREAGLKEENMEVAGLCTRCRTDLFYSYRGEGKTGRFATVAMIV
jgi:YfiH family protein